MGGPKSRVTSTARVKRHRSSVVFVVKENALVPFNACYCLSCNFLCEECAGISEDTEFACCQCICCLKADAPPLWCKGLVVDDNTCCQVGLGICQLVCRKPTVCCKQQTQCFCCVQECSLPPDDERPPMVAFLGMQCVPATGCCRAQGTLISRSKSGDRTTGASSPARQGESGGGGGGKVRSSSKGNSKSKPASANARAAERIRAANVAPDEKDMNRA